MKNVIKHSILYVVLMVCTGLGLVIFTSLVSGKKNILGLMDNALKETIDIDFNRRKDKAAIRYTNKPQKRKVKGTKIISKDGVEVREFKDSIEEYIAYQLAIQYTLAQRRPINPDNFNAIFKEELNKEGITCQTGIIYRHNGKPQYSGKDSTIFHQAIMTQPVILDAKETVSIQAWAKCDWITILRYAHWETFGVAIVFLAAFIFIFFFHKREEKVKDKNADISMPTEAVTKNDPPIQKGIRVDENERKIYIDDKECVTTNLEFEMLSLLISQPDHFATNKQIIHKLWPKEEMTTSKLFLYNRKYNLIRKLRETFAKFPGYGIESVSGKGFCLITPQP